MCLLLTFILAKLWEAISFEPEQISTHRVLFCKYREVSIIIHLHRYMYRIGKASNNRYIVAPLQKSVWPYIAMAELLYQELTASPKVQVNFIAYCAESLLSEIFYRYKAVP